MAVLWVPWQQWITGKVMWCWGSGRVWPGRGVSKTQLYLGFSYTWTYCAWVHLRAEGSTQYPCHHDRVNKTRWRLKWKVKSLSHVRLFATPWPAAYQAPPSMDFPGQSTGVGCHCHTTNTWVCKALSLLFHHIVLTVSRWGGAVTFINVCPKATEGLQCLPQASLTGGWKGASPERCEPR